MPSTSYYKKHTKVWYKPLIPNERLRTIGELMMLNTYGLKNKREIWRSELFLAKIKRIAGISTLQNQRTKESRIKRYSILWFCFKFNILTLDDNSMNLIVGVKLVDILKRRLQTFLLHLGYAQTIHESRVLIMHKYIRVRDQVVNKPGFLIKAENEKYISVIITLKKRVISKKNNRYMNKYPKLL